MVRAVAASAILALPSDESASALLPLLSDEDEFVRREAIYALGHTRNRSATSALSERLLSDKLDSIRAAAAVALSEIADESSVVVLSNVLAPELSSGSKRKREKNSFVLRSVARALGEMKSRAGVPALAAALNNDKLDSDVRREAARSLGYIGDPAALPALKSAEASSDPYLAKIAHQAIMKLSN